VTAAAALAAPTALAVSRFVRVSAAGNARHRRRADQRRDNHGGHCRRARLRVVRRGRLARPVHRDHQLTTWQLLLAINVLLLLVLRIIPWLPILRYGYGIWFMGETRHLLRI
jgi:hypothetical protein